MNGVLHVQWVNTYRAATQYSKHSVITVSEVLSVSCLLNYPRVVFRYFQGQRYIL